MTISAFAREILRGKDLYRVLLNAECEQVELSGLVVDAGGGVAPSYHRFFKKSRAPRVESVGLHSGVNFETDALPYAAQSADAVLLFNVLEHIYNYPRLLGECRRILKPGGALVGAVPFLVGFHPDPDDYWRFTRESLEHTFRSAGFELQAVRAFGAGPFAAGFSHVEFVMPRVFKLVLAPTVLAADRLACALKPELTERFPLGYFFELRA